MSHLTLKYAMNELENAQEEAERRRKEYLIAATDTRGIEFVTAALEYAAAANEEAICRERFQELQIEEMARVLAVRRQDQDAAIVAGAAPGLVGEPPIPQADRPQAGASAFSSGAAHRLRQPFVGNGRGYVSDEDEEKFDRLLTDPFGRDDEYKG